MIRVAALMDTINVSGPARQLVAIVEPLRAIGVELHVLAFHPAKKQDTPFVRFLESERVPHTAVPAYGRLRWRTLVALNEVIEQLAPTIVQTHSYRPNAHFLLLRALRYRREPWLAFFHGTTAENSLVKLYHKLDRRMLAHADAVAVVAEAQLAQVGRASGVTVVANAVLPPKQDGASAPTLRATEYDTVLYVGRLSHEKGVDVLLRAWPTVRAAHARARLQIVGDGPDRQLLTSLAESLGESGSVEFFGHHAEPWHFYRTANVVVLPSRSEGIPNVLLEAIARDVPVVATRVGGIPTVLGDPPAGLLVEADRPQELAAALVAALLGEVDDRLRTLRTAVREKFSLTARASSLAALYARLLAARAEARR